MGKPLGAYTPGPWSLFSEGNTLQVSAGHGHRATDAVVFWTGFDASTRPIREKQANARLITSAPDLLERLKTTCDCLRDIAGAKPGEPWGWAWEEVLDEAMEIIRQATEAP